MVAAPFTGNLTVRFGNGMIESYRITASDVAAAAYVFQDGSSDIVLPSNRGNCMVSDLILSAAGTDTAQADIFVNGKDTGQVIQNSANLGTVFNRQFMSSPITIAAGARLKILQTA